MGYKVKWVEDNLGVSRKALRNFEKLGLMPANEGGGYRNYSDEDIERIWYIRVLQNVGYSLKEIAKITIDGTFDTASIEEKIKELESKKADIENHLNYAKTIKFTGRIPTRPKDMGTISCQEFNEKAINEWNTNTEPCLKKYQEMADFILNTPEDEFKYTDLGKLFEFFQGLQEMRNHADDIMIELIIPDEIIKRKNNGSTDPEVQLLVKMLYENMLNSSPDMSLYQFVKFVSSSYICGDIARIQEQKYGKDGCAFMADAIAVFGGYKCYDEVDD